MMLSFAHQARAQQPDILESRRTELEIERLELEVN
jgi:hypothetical protein